MSESVARRMDDDSFCTVIERLEPGVGITDKTLVTFMSDSVAVRLDADSFFKSLQRLTQVFGITGAYLVRFGVLQWRW